MLEYIIICIGLVLAAFMWLIFKRIDNKNNNKDEIKSVLDQERERKKDLNEVKDKILETINTQNTSLKEDFVSIKERVSTVQKAQEQIGKLANEVVDFKNLFSNKTERGRLGEEYLEDLVSDTMSKQHYKFQFELTNKNHKSICLKEIFFLQFLNFLFLYMHWNEESCQDLIFCD